MGLFKKNYDKPGKGVSKNEPEKKGFFRFFELYFRNFWILLSAELWYILLSIPLLTSGLANVGMAYICRMAARDKHVFLTSDFFGAIKSNWKRALPLGIINTIINLVFVADMYCLYLLWKLNPDRRTFLLIVFVVSVFIYSMFSFAKYYMYTLMVTFDYKLSTIFKNSWLFATLGIKHNIIIGGVSILIYMLAFLLLVINFDFGAMIIMVVAIFFYPSFKMFLIQFNVFPEVKKYIIDPYYAQHPDDDIEMRRELGILENDDEEAIFDDNQKLD